MPVKFINQPITVSRTITGLWSFDRAFINNRGDIGLPNWMIELYGPSYSGKSTFAYSLAGIVCMVNKRKKIALADLEGFDLQYVADILDSVHFDGDVKLVDNDVDEKILDELIVEIKDKSTGAAIFDSVAAISPISEATGAHGDANMGRRAKLMAQHSRKLIHALRADPKIAIYINHVLTNLGFVGSYTPGGDTKKYMAGIRISVKRQETFPDESTAIVGTVQKNKFGIGNRKFYAVLLSGKGVHPGLSALYDCIQSGLITKAKGERSYKVKSTGEKLSLKSYFEHARNNNNEVFNQFYDMLNASQETVKEALIEADDDNEETTNVDEEIEENV